MIISIRTPNTESSLYPEKSYNLQAVLPVWFADVSDPAPSAGGISAQQAEQIAQFVRTWWDKVDLMIVHCDAGVSRSAGVGAAILKAMTGSDRQIFDDPFRVPNMLCYRRVLTALME